MKKTRLLTMATAAALGLSFALSACGGSKDTPATNAPATNAPATNAPAGNNDAATQTPATQAPAALADGQIVADKLTLKAVEYELENQQMGDWNKLYFYEQLEAKTNIHIEWTAIKDGDWKTKTNLMFVSGDLPDMFLRGALDVEDYGVLQKLLVPLDPYVRDKNVMPNYADRIDLNGAADALPASDGQMYYIGNLIAQNVSHDGNHYINKMWLDKLGLQIPKTIDELKTVLIAFRDQDPNGNGEKDEIPFSGADLIHQTQGLYNHFASFGVPLERYLYAAIDKNDKVNFIADETAYPGFRAACEFLNWCYAENILDKEAITQDSNVWVEKVNAGLVGYTTYLRTINTAWQAEIAANYVSILPPTTEYGTQVPEIMEVPAEGAYMTSTNKHVVESLKWIDAQLETALMMEAYNGPLTDTPIEHTMEIVDGKYNILYVPEDNGLYKYYPVYHAQFFAPGDYYTAIYQMPPHRLERYNTSKEYKEAGVLEPRSFFYLQKFVKPNNEEGVELGSKFNELEKLFKESLATFITKGVTDANWDKFQKDAKSIGSERYVEIYQKAYDKYLGK